MLSPDGLPGSWWTLILLVRPSVSPVPSGQKRRQRPIDGSEWECREEGGSIQRYVHVSSYSSIDIVIVEMRTKPVVS